MTLCEGLSDRMPMVAAGRAQWSDEESTHLASCADCAAEWRLIGGVRHLGATVPVGDPALIAVRIRERLAGELSAKVIPLRPRRSTGWMVGLALAAAVVLAIAVPRWSDRSEPGGAGQSTQVLSELDDLSATELEAVLKEFDSGPGIGESAPAGTGDLNTDELERILRSMEG